MTKTILAYPLVLLFVLTLLICGAESTGVALSIVGLYGLATVGLPSLYRRLAALQPHWSARAAKPFP